ncbi:CaiB/BaiF CoA transferase family protein [Streptodolium elevatio]
MVRHAGRSTDSRLEAICMVPADLKVLDVSHGVAGPMTAMLLADHGASVTRIEAPCGGPLPDLPGRRVWNRGKRSAVLDLKTATGREALYALAQDADVLVESYSPATRGRLGLDHAVLAELNPRLVHCSITGYGEGTRDSARPGYDALVAARSGLHWEKRGRPGGGINHQAGLPDPLAGIEVPAGVIEGPDRDGPLFSGVPLPSIGAFYLASVGVNAALHARERTGRGQHVRTSLRQGVFAAVIGGWQRMEHTDRPFLQTWIFDSRAPMGVFRCADGAWVHNWVPNPSWIIAMGELDSLDDASDDQVAGGGRHRDDPDRLGTEPENLVVLHHYHPLMAAAFAKFPAAEWERAGARKGTPIQIVRPPHAALSDPWWIQDGCVAEVEDPDEGPIRMVGRTYTVTGSEGRPHIGAPRPGTHTEQVLAQAGHARATHTAATATPPRTATSSSHTATPPPPRTATPPPPEPTAPLAGVRVLDLGLAIAGPYGCQVLADMGADVVKINALHDGYWQCNHIAMTANRNKRSLALNLKDPRGLAVLRRMVAKADVVQHNMRYDAAVRLGVDEDALRTIRPDLVYCHTRGFEESGPRAGLPGNDQTGAALAGVEWEDGGVDDGGRPIWSRTNFGDTGNGFLSAIGIMQALTRRARTGEGARVDTSIVYAQLLSSAAAGAYVRADGTEPDRPRLDADHYGLGALYRLYRCADDRWLCLAAVTAAHRAALAKLLTRQPHGIDPADADADADADAETEAAALTADDPRTPPDDGMLAAFLERTFAQDPADTWLRHLDEAGVPAEISSETYSLEVFDDPEMVERGWVARFDHPYVGRLETTGLGVEFSETPGELRGPTPVVGEHSREVLADYGFAADEVDELVAAGVVRAWEPGTPVLPGT